MNGSGGGGCGGGGGDCCCGGGLVPLRPRPCIAVRKRWAEALGMGYFLPKLLVTVCQLYWAGL